MRDLRAVIAREVNRRLGFEGMPDDEWADIVEAVLMAITKDCVIVERARWERVVAVVRAVNAFDAARRRAMLETTTVERMQASVSAFEAEIRLGEARDELVPGDLAPSGYEEDQAMSESITAEVLAALAAEVWTGLHRVALGLRLPLWTELSDSQRAAVGQAVRPALVHHLSERERADVDQGTLR